jgi:ubiquinone/menaquinone biosynthesis C-methylase UbiE
MSRHFDQFVCPRIGFYLRDRLAGVRDYYEELWERLPVGSEPADLDLRRRFLRAEARPGDRALDLGCGDGTLTAELARANAQVVGAEVAQAAITRAAQAHPDLRFELISMDRPLPFADNEFDLVWSSEVIEHVADTARWLSEVRRVLAPGGRLALTTPSHGRLRLALGGIERYSEPLGDHLHLYTRRSLAEVLHEFGFDPVGVRAAGGPPLMRRLLLAHAQR